MADLKYEVSKEIGVLSERKGWTKKLKLISWNGRPAKYDIREWSTPDDEELTKGITLNKEEMIALVELMKEELKED